MPLRLLFWDEFKCYSQIYCSVKFSRIIQIESMIENSSKESDLIGYIISLMLAKYFISTRKIFQQQSKVKTSTKICFSTLLFEFVAH